MHRRAGAKMHHRHSQVSATANAAFQFRKGATAVLTYSSAVLPHLLPHPAHAECAQSRMTVGAEFDLRGDGEVPEIGMRAAPWWQLRPMRICGLAACCARQLRNSLGYPWDPQS